MKNFIKEFKEFVCRGNVVDLAVAVIIGGAFQKIIASLVNDIIMPLVTLCTGGINFTDWFIAFNGNTYATLAEAQKAGAATLNYGTFLTSVINFIIMAFVIFMMIKLMNKFARKNVEEAVVPNTTKICPFCK
ncbi:MAG: large conductance mechanosensitive channel protein MscL, partial [Longicatena sp.]